MNYLVRDVQDRLENHRENLRLWESGYLSPTEPGETERERVTDRLRAAIGELEWVLSALPAAGPAEPPERVFDRRERPTTVWFRNGEKVRVATVVKHGRITDAFLEVGAMPSYPFREQPHGPDVLPIREIHDPGMGSL